jgi:hypothetical protein
VRTEITELLDCIELDQADALACMAKSAATTTADSDEVARRIFELQETLFGVTATPAP